MAQWQVVAAPIELFPHPTSDKLQVGKVAQFQVVVSKENGYLNGDVVVFAPERSVLPEDLRPHYVNTDTGISYLSGEDHDRVKAVRLRGELSEGVTIPLAWAYEKLVSTEVIATDASLPLNWDLSKALGITKYIPQIPKEMQGKLIAGVEIAHSKKHDVEQFLLYENEFVAGEMVRLYEKVHGSQIRITKNELDAVSVASKSSADDGFSYIDDGNNLYWNAARASGLLDRIHVIFAGHEVQVFGEVIPCQKGGFTYGQTVGNTNVPSPTVRFYRVIVNGQEVPYAHLDIWPDLQFFRENWVPLIYKGPYDRKAILAAVPRREQVSGKELHISEGGVLSPEWPRLTRDHHPLMVKLINPRFKGSDEDFS